MMNILHSCANVFSATDNWLVRVLVFRGQEAEPIEKRRGNRPHGRGISRPTKVEEPQSSDVELISWRRHNSVNGRFHETCRILVGKLSSDERVALTLRQEGQGISSIASNSSFNWFDIL